MDSLVAQLVSRPIFRLIFVFSFVVPKLRGPKSVQATNTFILRLSHELAIRSAQTNGIRPIQRVTIVARAERAPYRGRM